jgi:hypothetical protein
MPEAQRRPRLDLNENQVVALFGNDVNLARPATPVAVENDILLRREERDGCVFAESSDLLVAHEYHLREGV